MLTLARDAAVPAHERLTPKMTAYRPASLKAPPQGAPLSLGARPQPPNNPDHLCPQVKSREIGAASSAKIRPLKMVQSMGSTTKLAPGVSGKDHADLSRFEPQLRTRQHRR